MSFRASPAYGLLFSFLVLAKPVLGVEPALPPTPADVSDWSRLLDAAPPSPGGDGPLLAGSLGRTAYAALVHGRPGLAEAAFRKAGANSPEVKAEEADLYFAAAGDLYDDCRWWWRRAPFVLLYLDIAAKKGSRRMARMDELVRVMRADLAGIEDSWVFPEEPSPESLQKIVKEAESETLMGLVRARHDQTVADMRSLAAALDAYGKEHGRLPDGNTEALWTKLTQQGGTLQRFDAWGTRFRIEVSRDLRHARMVSAGADRRFEALPALDPAAMPEHRTTADPARDVVMQDGKLVQEWREPLAEPVPVGFLRSEEFVLASSESLAAHRATMASMLLIYKACEAYKKDKGVYPPGSLERIEASLVPAYLARFPKLDARGTPFRVNSEIDRGRQIRIVSAGADRIFERLAPLSPTSSPKPREVGDPDRDIVLENGRFVQYWEAVSPEGCRPPSQVVPRTGAGSDSAPPSGWTALGPYAGRVECLATDPKNPLTIYLGTNRGDIFRSADGGVSWKRVRTADPVRNDPIWDLAVTPSQVWAAVRNGLLRSTDGGNTWSKIGAGLRKTSVRALLVDAESPMTLFAGTFEGIYRSVNGGDDFVSVNRGMETLSIAKLARGTRTPRTIYLATRGRGMAKSTDGGETWKPASRGLVQPNVNALVVDPKEPSRLWAATDGGVFVSSDAAESWTFAVALGKRNVNALFIDERAPRTLLAITAEGTFRSEDGGQGWTIWSRGAPPPTVRALTSGSAGSILAATNSLGVFRSTDGGRSWAPSSRGLSASEIDTVAVDPLQPRTLLAGGGATAWRSSDGGVSWKDVGESLSVGMGYAQLLVNTFAFDTRKQGIVYAADLEGVFRSTDEGLSWKTCEMPKAAYALAVDPARPDTVWAGSLHAVFASDDSCATWRKLPATFGETIVLRILFSQSAPGPTFVATAGGLYRTDDGGKSFQGPVEGLGGRIRVTSLAADPVHPATVWAGTEKGLFVSRDGGTSWTATGPPGVGIVDVVVHPKSSSRVFAGTDAGVIVTSDGGASWTALNESLPGGHLECLRLDPEGKTLYAATSGGGVLSLQLRD